MDGAGYSRKSFQFSPDDMNSMPGREDDDMDNDSRDVAEKPDGHIAGPCEETVARSTDKEQWNHPRINMYRFGVALYSFIVMGMNDAVTGALIPYIERHYEISYTVVSLLFLPPFAGYVLAGLLNNLVHHKAGQRGVAMVAPICRLLAYVPMSLHPPYPVLPVAMLFAGIGNGLEDGAWNAWVGDMDRANEMLGFLHGAYGLGATISPLVASAMVTKGRLPWYTFYYVMVGLSLVELLVATTAFWAATAEAHRERHKSTTGQQRTTTRRALRQGITWLLAVFLMVYVGVEVSLGGWIVTFMLRVRHAEPFLAGISVTLFWLGLTLGRVFLGFITGRIGEKLAITAYLALAIALQLLYWLVDHLAASLVFVIMLGFFLGPLFPAAIVAATKLMTRDFHVSAIGFAAAFGGAGAAVLPFAVGAIAEKKGVQVLQPIVLAMLVVQLALWLLVPGGMRRGGLEMARENGSGIRFQPRRAIMDRVRGTLGRRAS